MSWLPSPNCFGCYTWETEAKKNSIAAIKGADRQLGNSSAVCRQRYLHPVLEHDRCGKIKPMPTKSVKNALPLADISMGIGEEEQDVLFILRNCAMTHL
jgi:DNA topoisomerase IB